MPSQVKVIGVAASLCTAVVLGCLPGAKFPLPAKK